MLKLHNPTLKLVADATQKALQIETDTNGFKTAGSIVIGRRFPYLPSGTIARRVACYFLWNSVDAFYRAKNEYRMYGVWN